MNDDNSIPISITETDSLGNTKESMVIALNKANKISTELYPDLNLAIDELTDELINLQVENKILKDSIEVLLIHCNN